MNDFIHEGLALLRDGGPNDPTVEDLLALYRVMVLARELDGFEIQLVRQGQAFFQVSGAGHEATAALAFHLGPCDYLHPHYRDKALLLARGMTAAQFLNGLLCTAHSPSAGRQMCAHPSDASLNILSTVGPVGNNALQAAGVAAALRNRPDRPVVACMVGDGTTQQGEFLEAVAEAVRWRLPVLFVVEDNRWAISTPTTGKTSLSLPGRRASELLGLPVQSVDGSDPLAAWGAFGSAVGLVRAQRKPAMLWADMARLSNHTHADDQLVYRRAEEIAAATATRDPIARLAAHLRAIGVSDRKLDAIRLDVARHLEEAQAAALAAPNPATEQSAKRPLPVELSQRQRERRGDANGARLTMREALGGVLRHHLESDSRVMLYGQDIEDPKGDVFGVTRGLSSAFPGRVLNAPLSESTIVGTAIGRALAGERPVAFLQFTDFLPLAFNQLASELGTLHWRTCGEWQAPVIVLACCGGFRPGLGPFHAQTLESTVCHIPGLDVAFPSNATDGAGMLNAAFASGRPTVMLYPKALLNDSTVATPSDVARQLIPLGTSRILRAGRDITLIGWGNTVRLCQRAAQELEAVSVEAEIIDLRWLSPWDRESVIRSAQKTGRLVVVHEDNHTCGFGAEVLATVAELAGRPIQMRRVARADVPVPCNFGNQLDVLPSLRLLLAQCAELLDLDFSWDMPPTQPRRGSLLVDAVGSGPADELVVLAKQWVKPGDPVTAGQTIADLEASKATFEMSAPADGTVVRWFASEGESIAVGTPLVELATGSPSRPSPVTSEVGSPRLARRPGPTRASTILRPRATAMPSWQPVGVLSIGTELGRSVVENAVLLRDHRGHTEEGVFRATGIHSRRWAADGQTTLSMAASAARRALATAGLSVGEIDLIVLSTGSPDRITPSLACRLLHQLAGETHARAAAYDINAACSGYLYALRAAGDYLQTVPDGRALVVTAEVVSQRLNVKDPETAFIFGDAATATVLAGPHRAADAPARLYRPEISARGEAGNYLSVPLSNADQFIEMHGAPVFREAVQSMVLMLNRACSASGVDLRELDLIVPHQANQRILDAVGKRTQRPVYSNIRDLGNTSSSTIPLALSDLMCSRAPSLVGLAAFGGGFTFAAALLALNDVTRAPARTDRCTMRTIATR